MSPPERLLHPSGTRARCISQDMVAADHRYLGSLMHRASGGFSYVMRSKAIGPTQKSRAAALLAPAGSPVPMRRILDKEVGRKTPET